MLLLLPKTTPEGRDARRDGWRELAQHALSASAAAATEALDNERRQRPNFARYTAVSWTNTLPQHSTCYM